MPNGVRAYKTAALPVLSLRVPGEPPSHILSLIDPF